MNLLGMEVNNMYRAEVVLKNEAGLHARPASMFVNKANKYNSEITLLKEEKEYNGKSIMGILSMGAIKNTSIMIKAKGKDEREAVEALKELVDSNFGE